MGINVKSILDPSFKYTPSSTTDLRKTFARLRREQRMFKQQTSHVAKAGEDVHLLLQRSLNARSKKGGTL